MLDLWKIVDDEGEFGFESAMTAFEESVQNMISNNLFIVFDDNRNAVGFVGIYTFHERKRHHGIRIYLNPENRGKGYGMELVDIVKFLAGEKNITEIFAVVYKNNRPSKSLFIKDGWKVSKTTEEKVYFSFNFLK